jgi:hypothetical protein
MFGWLRKRRALPPTEEPKVLVFLNPLAMLLAGRESQKGSPLTEQEVLEVRDSAQCIAMTASQAEKFYASLDAQVPVPRLNPENLWQEWQEFRSHMR